MNLSRVSLIALLFALAAPACREDGPSETRTIEITFPGEGSIQRNSRVRVSGTAENVDQLDVNGEVAEVVGGQWEALVPVDQGEVTVVATGGGERDEVTFTVDSVPPILNVTSPQRAIYRVDGEGDTVTVSGMVTDDGTGLELIKVGEQIIRPTAEGSWSWDLALTPGMNEINVTARDVAGNEVDDIRGVMYGQFAEPTQTIAPAFDIWLDERATSDIEELIEGFLTSENLTVMAGAFENDNINIDQITLDESDLTVTLQRGSVDLYLVARGLEVNGTFTLSGEQFPLVVGASRLGVRISVTPIVGEEGLLDVEFSEPELELTPEDLTYEIADLSDADNEFLEGVVIDAATTGFGYVLSLGLFQALYDPDILKRKVNLLGRELVFDVRFEDIDIFPDGGLFRTSVTMPAERFADVRDDSPGALNRAPGPGSGSEPTSDIAFSTTENAIDRILHGVWYSGLLHHTLAGDDFSGIELPFELRAGVLGALIDSQITTIVSPETPAGIRLRPMFAPVSHFDTENSRLLFRVGEFMVDLMLLPPGQEPIVLATLSAFVDMSVNIGIREGVVVELDFDTELRADVAEEPVVDLDDEKVETLLEDLIALIPTLVAQSLDLSGEADITYVTLGNPQIQVHGANKDYATLNLEITAKPQTLEPPDPDAASDGM